MLTCKRSVIKCSSVFCINVPFVSVPSVVYTMPDDKSPVRRRPESSNAGFGRPDSFMPTHRVPGEWLSFRRFTSNLSILNISETLGSVIALIPGITRQGLMYVFSTTENLLNLLITLAMISEYRKNCSCHEALNTCLLRFTDLQSMKPSDRTDSAMTMMFRFSRRCRGLMLRSLELNTLGTARHLPWSVVGLCRLVDVVVSGRVSWLDVKTIWIVVVGSIAAASRSLGGMVTLVPVD